MTRHKLSPAGSTRGNLGAKLFLIVVTTLLSALAIAFVVAVSGGVTGHEFCPETFSLRSVQYFQLPLVRFQVTPTVRTDQSANALLAHIRGQAAWKPAKNRPHWDLASARGYRLEYEGDANVLYQYLITENDSNKNPWVEWSQAHPDLAEIVWPAVVDAARKRQYLLIPHLLERATQFRTKAELRASIQQLHQEAAGWLAQLELPVAGAANPATKAAP